MPDFLPLLLVGVLVTNTQSGGVGAVGVRPRWGSTEQNFCLVLLAIGASGMDFEAEVREALIQLRSPVHQLFARGEDDAGVVCELGVCEDELDARGFGGSEQRNERVVLLFSGSANWLYIKGLYAAGRPTRTYAIAQVLC